MSSPSQTLSIHSYHAQLSLLSKPFFFNLSFTVLIHLFLDLPIERLSAHTPLHIPSYPLRNHFSLHSFCMAKPSENTFINLFVHTPRHSTYPCILDFIHSPVSTSFFVILFLLSSFDITFFPFTGITINSFL